SFATDNQKIDLRVAASADINQVGNSVNALTGNGEITGMTTINGITTVSSTGSQTPTLTINTTNQFVGGAFQLQRSNATTSVTSIGVTLAGTAVAGDLANMKLYTDTAASCSTASFPGSATQFGSTAASPTISK